MSDASIQITWEYTFTMKANTMNFDQTAPKGADWSGFILFAIKDTKVRKQMREQTTIVNDRKMVHNFN